MSNNDASSHLGTIKISKLMVKMAVPSVVAQLVNLLYNIVDRIYIGHIEGIGAAALTGVGLCLPLIMFMNAFALLVSAGGAPRASIAMGQGNRKQAEYIMGNCFTMLLIFAGLITAVYLVWAEELLMMFGASADTIPYALGYMRIYAVGAVFVLIVMGMNTFLTSQGFTKFAMDLGVQGAAIATVLSQAVGAVWVMWFLTKGKKTILYLRASCMKLVGKVIGPCLLLGISGFVMIATESVLSICFNTSLQAYGGDLAVGSMTIIASCSQLALMPTAGICQGCQPITSYNFGAGNVERVKQCVKLQLIICGGYTTVFWIASMVAPQMFVRIFNDDPQLVDHTVWALRIYMTGIFAMGFQTTCQQCFMALGQAAVSLLLACLRKLVLLIPLIYILPLFFADKVFAVFLAEPVCDILAASVTVMVFFSRFHKILREGPKRI